MRANKIVFGFFGAAWVAFESCGQWIDTPDGKQWESAADYLDTETHDSREYAIIYPGGEYQPRKWWEILTDEQRAQIAEFAESKRNTTAAAEILRINEGRR